MKRNISTIILVGFIAMFVSCNGDKEEKSESEVGEIKKEVIQAQQEMPKAPPPINEELAEKGEEIFKTKGCIACHTIGKGRLTGPDLAGVTERRKLDWIENQILHPEEMLEKDSIAKELLATYLVKMPNQNVTPEEAKAIIMYLREKDSEAKEGSEDEK
ncbi:MAG: c-type cytochrome [Thermodesulfobacteriota bacterium]